MRFSSSLRSRRPHVVGLGLGLAVAAVACSSSVKVTAQTLIEGELADQIGLGELVAVCQEPEEAVVGESFECIARTTDRQQITFVGVFEEEDKIFVYPTNLIAQSEMSTVESLAAEQLSPVVSETIEASDVVCPDETVVLDADGSMECEITQPSTGLRYPLTATFTDFVREDGFQHVDFEIGDTPL